MLQKHIARPLIHNPDWDLFIQNTRTSNSHALVDMAIKQCKGVARHHVRGLDLGAGSLRDTQALLKSGFRHVDAVDTSLVMRECAELIEPGRVTVHICDIRSFRTHHCYDLIVAMNVLPFFVHSDIRLLYHRIAQVLHTGGVFCGTLYGIRHSWNNPLNTHLTFHHHNKETLEHILRIESGGTLRIIFFQDNDFPSVEHDGQEVDFHCYSFIAIKE